MPENCLDLLARVNPLAVVIKEKQRVGADVTLDVIEECEEGGDDLLFLLSITVNVHGLFCFEVEWPGGIDEIRERNIPSVRVKDPKQKSMFVPLSH